MSSMFIPVNEPLLEGNERKYLNECIDTGWISSEGPFVNQLENDLATRLHRRHGIAVTNGTSAIDVAVESLNIKPGDEVILPSFTIISCVLQIVRAGAIPVLVDSELDTWNMDISQVEEKITSRTRAIMAVHIYGLPVDMDPIIELCRHYNLLLIEDAAEQIGQSYKGRPCGSFGDVSTLSFYPNKHITTGEGGMVLTNDDHLATQIRELRNLCFKPENRFVHDRLGWNLRMTNLQAAVGVAQLEQLDDFIEKKRWIGQMYNQLFKNTEGISLPLSSTEYADNIYWVYGIVLEEKIRFDAKEVIRRLGKLNIGCRPFFCPLHMQPALKEKGFFNSESFPNSELLYNRGFYIPSGLTLNREKIEIVADAITRILG